MATKNTRRANKAAKPKTETTKAPAPEVTKDATVAGEATAAVLPKCAQAHPVKNPPRRLFARLTKIKDHPGKALRIKRWGLYKDGMTLLHCRETPGLDDLDVGFYVQNGLMKLTQATDEEYEKGLAAHRKRHGIEDPKKAEEKKAS